MSSRGPGPLAAPALLLAAICLLFAAPPRIEAAPETAAQAPVAVIFPRVREPYRAAFLAIVEGIAKEIGARAQVQEVDPSETAADISERIAARQSGTAVLLGQYGLQIAQSLDDPREQVIGAVLARPQQLREGARGISMVPAPRQLFATLRKLAPAVERVTVVYGADDNDWLIERATAAAAEQGLKLQAIRRDSLHDGATAIREVLPTLTAHRDAVWLLQASPLYNENSVLQTILRAAWDRNLVVFSSNLSHVPKGALFALFPDNEAMGRALGRMAITPYEPDVGLQLLEQLHTAINIRTANHLGLGLNASDPRFNLVFPSR